jgi:hypothetical protein
LYRIPEPVTVAANAQKQVGLLDKPAVRVQPVYVFMINGTEASSETAGQLFLRSVNRESEGLGLPLPGGNLVLFREGASRPLLVGEALMRDTAVGEKVAMIVAEASGVRARLTSNGNGGRTLVLTNDRPLAVSAEVQLEQQDDVRIDGARLSRRDGKLLWLATVPANGSATLAYRVRRR